MRVSSEKVAEHREALLATARRLLQERGFDGAGVAAISREAGLTQGALYGQFRSKDALAAEAIRKAFAEGMEVWKALRGSDPRALEGLLEEYLSEGHVNDPGTGCALAACVSEIGRQDAAIAAASRTSSTTGATVAPLARHAATTMSSRASSRPDRWSVVPGAASAWASAAPMPDEAPVMRTDCIARNIPCCRGRGG